MNQPPPTAETISKVSPARTGSDLCRPRGTTSPFFSTAIFFPASPSSRTNAATVPLAGRGCPFTTQTALPTEEEGGIGINGGWVKMGKVGMRWRWFEWEWFE